VGFGLWGHARAVEVSWEGRGPPDSDVRGTKSLVPSWRDGQDAARLDDRTGMFLARLGY
jgi:hypothetical protein